MKRLVTIGVLVGISAACSSTSPRDGGPLPQTTVTEAPATPTPATGAAPSTTSVFAAPNGPSSTAAPTWLVLSTGDPASTSPTSTTTETERPAPVTPDLIAGATPYGLPVADIGKASWGTTHSAYPASDIFVRCGATLVAPVNGVVTEARRVNAYDPSIDNPATRGGRSVTIIGDDGVRYYMAHFEVLADGIEPGVRITIGETLGQMGRTGRTSACHLHFGISPPCPGKEWSVRRGVIWPYPYLDAWRANRQDSPVDEIKAWLDQHPSACADAMADPNAGDS
jgi:peptidoglycan LD-endopeptidase LytH